MSQHPIIDLSLEQGLSAPNITAGQAETIRDSLGITTLVTDLQNDINDTLIPQINQVQSNLTTHINNSTGAHAATAISNLGSGGGLLLFGANVNATLVSIANQTVTNTSAISANTGSITNITNGITSFKKLNISGTGSSDGYLHIRENTNVGFAFNYIGTGVSNVFNTNAGALGTGLGNKLFLGSFGCTTGGNQQYLNFIAYRHTGGNDSTGSSIGFTRGVDNSEPGEDYGIWIRSDGNIGIGEYTPSQKLDVNGTAKATLFSGPLSGNVTGNVTGNISSPTNTDLTVLATGNQKISLQTNSSERVVINGDGSVEINGAVTNTLTLSDTVDPLVLSGGTTGQRAGSPTLGTVRYNTTNLSLEYYNGYAWISIGGIVDKPGADITTPTTLALSHIGQVLSVNSVGSVNITIPPNSIVAFPIGTIINIYREGTGDVKLIPGTGVSFKLLGQTHTPADVVDGDEAKISIQYGEVSLRKDDTNTWVIIGDINLVIAP